jgi:acetyl esterase/lipase
VRTVSYGDHPDQVIDVWDGGDTVAVLIHGGYWRQRYDRSTLVDFARWLAARGLSVANVDYRRIPGWPVIFTDVVAGVDESVKLFPGKRIVLVGHSAGGHLALLAADRPGVAKVVAVGGLCDLARAHELGLSDNAVSEMLRGDLSQLPAADPMNRLPLPVPVTLLHGDADDHVPLEESERFKAKAGDTVELVVLPGADHFEPVAPGAVRTLAAIQRR